MLIYHQYCRVENHSHICMQSRFHDQTKTFYIHVPGACMPNCFLALGKNRTKGYADCIVGCVCVRACVRVCVCVCVCGVVWWCVCA